MATLPQPQFPGKCWVHADERWYGRLWAASAAWTLTFVLRSESLQGQRQGFIEPLLLGDEGFTHRVLIILHYTQVPPDLVQEGLQLDTKPGFPSVCVVLCDHAVHGEWGTWQTHEWEAELEVRLLEGGRAVSSAHFSPRQPLSHSQHSSLPVCGLLVGPWKAQEEGGNGVKEMACYCKQALIASGIICYKKLAMVIASGSRAERETFL